MPYSNGWKTAGILEKTGYFKYINTINLEYYKFQPPIYDPQGKHYEQYGNLGNVLAHELTHAISLDGSQFDKDGKEVQWYSEGSLNNLTSLAQVMVDQVNNYKYRGRRMNGSHYLFENLAALGGITIAHKAYSKLPPESPPPRSTETAKQLFWRTRAKTLCSFIGFSNKYLDKILMGRHGLVSFTIMVELSNSVEFSQDYNCAPDTKMNPTEKCTIF